MTASEQLKLVQDAIQEILTYGQENYHGDRRVVRARLDNLLELQRRLQLMVSGEEQSDQSPNKGRNKIRYFEPK
jgi:hypothetical protein